MTDALIAQPIDPPKGAVTLFGSDKPAEVIKAAGDVADALRDVLRKQNLTISIRGRSHVLVDGWTLAGTLLGVFPVPVWTRPLTEEIDGKKSFLGWEARVEARTRAGEVVGAAEAECRFSESRWSDADSYAVRSMAQTRATSKAMRLPLGFIISLAGYATTPAEEMPRDGAPQDDAEVFGAAMDAEAAKAKADPKPKKPPELPGTPEEHKAFENLCDRIATATTKDDVAAAFESAAALLPTKALRQRLHKYAGIVAARRKRDEARAVVEPGSNG